MFDRTASQGTTADRRAVALVALVLPALLVAALLGTSTADAATSTTVTFAPTQIAYTEPEIANTLRGQYAWSGQEQQPGSYKTLDTYYRDQVMWSRIEPTRGTYDWSWFDQGLADAGARGGKFGFRVMAWCPYCWRDATPSWLPRQAGTTIPDWNSPTFLNAWDDLMKALADRYANDPRLGYVDIGGYGKYGEWHTDGEGANGTPASIGRIIRSVHDRFPKQHVLINAMNTEGLTQALALDPKIGVRMDCLGLANFFYAFDHMANVQARWKTAPVMTEWCHATSTSTVTGAAQVKKYHVSTVSSGNTYTPYASMSATQQAGWRDAVKHSGYRYQLRSLKLPKSIRSGRAISVTTVFKNAGSAPTYDDWRVQLRLLDANNALVAKAPLTIDLRGLLTDTKTYSRTTTLTAAPGTYKVAVAVVDPVDYLDPMWLATKGRVAGGNYVLGSVKVTR
jgi:hypothetical protein